MAAALRSIILFSHDLASAASFYRDVTSFRSIVPNVFVNGSGLCDVIIKPSSFPEAPALRSPYLTVAVSNLSSSKRKVSGRGGSLLDVTSSDDWGTRAGVPFPPSAHSWAVACDPSGVASLLLHKFRRNSIISITMACADVDVASGAHLCLCVSVCVSVRVRVCACVCLRLRVCVSDLVLYPFDVLPVYVSVRLACLLHNFSYVCVCA